jgi:hypothetical protein
MRILESQENYTSVKTPVVLRVETMTTGILSNGTIAETANVPASNVFQEHVRCIPPSRVTTEYQEPYGTYESVWGGLFGKAVQDVQRLSWYGK